MLKKYLTRDDKEIYLDLSKASLIEKFDYLKADEGLEHGWRVVMCPGIDNLTVIKGITQEDVDAAVEEAYETSIRIKERTN